MRFTVLLAMCLLWASVNAFGQKRLLREAAELENEGRYAGAFGKYVEAMHRNNTKTETQDALTRTSEQLMGQWLDEYSTLRKSQSADEMLVLVAQIEKHQQQLDFFGLKTTLLTHDQKNFKADKDSILEGWYDQAVTHKKKGNYQKAIFYFDRITQIEADYRNVPNERQAVITAPIFKEAKEAYEQKQISKAWQLFDQLQPGDVNFQESKKYKRKIKEEHALTVSVLPSESNFHSQEYKLRETIVVALSKLNSPFIQLVDRMNLSVILQEQKLGVSGVVDESQVAEVGILLGAKAVLVTKVITYNYQKGPLQAFDKVAYQRFKRSGLAEYRSVNYKEYAQVNTLNISLQVQLISSETSKVLYADVINNQQENSMRFAEYDGNYITLYPIKGDVVYKSGKERETFLKLFEVRKDNIGLIELDQAVQQEIAQKISLGIEGYINTKF